MVNIQSESGRLEDKGSTSAVGTLANMLKGFIGSGIIGLPFAFRESGALTGVISLVILAILSLYSVHLLLDTLDPSKDKEEIKIKRASDKGKSDYVSLLDDKGTNDREGSKPMRATYDEIGEAAFGKWGLYIVRISLIYTQLGFCCVYIIFMGQNLYNVVLDKDPEQSKHWMLFALIFLPFLIAVCLLRSLKSLVPFSLIGQFTIFSGLAAAFAYCIISISKNGIGNGGKIHQLEINTYPIFFGTAAYVFEGIGIVVPLQRSMKYPEKFPRVLNLNFLITTIFYIVFGLAGYLAFGDGTISPITSNLPDNILGKIVKSTLIVAIFATYPIQLIPVIQITENLLFDRDTINLEMKRNLLRSSLVIFTTAAAFSIPHFDLFMSLIGSLGCSLLAFILPTAFHMKLRKVSLIKFLFHLFIIIFGVVGLVVSTAVTIQDIVEVSK